MTFGSNLKHLLFEPLDDITIDEVKQNLLTDLQLQEPRLIFTDADFIPDYDRSTLMVSISYKFRDRL